MILPAPYLIDVNSSLLTCRGRYLYPGSSASQHLNCAIEFDMFFSGNAPDVPEIRWRGVVPGHIRIHTDMQSANIFLFSACPEMRQFRVMRRILLKYVVMVLSQAIYRSILTCGLTAPDYPVDSASSLYILWFCRCPEIYIY